MKAKLMTLLLAVGLGVTGVAATVQAAEVGTYAVNDCEHVYERTDTRIDRGAADYNETYHIRHYEVPYVCKKCYHVDPRDEIEYEIHDYDNIYLDNGRILSICNGCGARTEG